MVLGRGEYFKCQWGKGALITRDVLSEMYLMKQMSSGDIGRHFGVTKETVLNKMKKCGIRTRPSVERLEGRKFYRRTVIEQVGNDKGKVTWRWRCDCGAEGITTTSQLKSSNAKSCGCLKRESARSRNGVNHPSYKTGRTNKEGYILMTDRNHPNAGKRGRILEHTVVMSKHLGRPLLSGESVHHKNGIKNDNRIENLELWSGKHSSGARVIDMVEFCVEYLNQYAPQKLARTPAWHS